MLESFKLIKKDGYGVVHMHNLGAFIVLPLNAKCDLTNIGKRIHSANIGKRPHSEVQKKHKLKK